MNWPVFVLLLAIALGFFISAYIFRESRKGGYMMLSGFIIILLLGILTIAQGITYPAGYTITDQGVDSVLTTTYTSVSTIENTVISFPFILAGLWGIIVVTNTLYSSRFDKEGEDEE